MIERLVELGKKLLSFKAFCFYVSTLMLVLGKIDGLVWAGILTAVITLRTVDKRNLDGK